MLLPSFQLHLNNSILSGLVTVGNYDGEHPELTCATTAGKVFVHSADSSSSGDDSQLRFLNINRRITSLRAGNLGRRSQARGDSLAVGTQATLLVYDVTANRDVLFRDAPDGVTSLLVGQALVGSDPCVVVGGNCSVHGVTADGEEAFWTVTGDVVSAMALLDVDGDGCNELLVGSEDYEIRVFQGESVVTEVTETEKVSGLCNMRLTRFGYALANGTVGVYDGTQRAWRAKSKNTCTAIEGYDLDGDGVPELVSGWATGRLEVRSDRDGKVVYKDTMGSAVAGLVRSDYRGTGHEEIVCCAADGEVRAYRTARDDQRAGADPRDAAPAGDGSAAGAAGGPSVLLGAGDDDDGADAAADALRELMDRKRALQAELSNLEASLKQSGKASDGAGSGGRRKLSIFGRGGGSESDKGAGERADATGGDGAEIIPPSTAVSAEVVINADLALIELVLSTNNDCVIRAVTIFAEQLFEGESHVHYPREAATVVKVPLRPARDAATSLDIKCFVGGLGATQFHVFELTRKLPRFSMYLLREPGYKASVTDGVRFTVPERVPRVVMWMNGAFAIDFSSIVADSIDVVFTSLRTGATLEVKVDTTGEGTSVAVITEDLALAAAVVQDMCDFLGIRELSSEATFDAELAALRAKLELVEGHNSVRMKLSVGMAESASVLKAALVRAEDARLRGDIEDMRGHYRSLAEHNRSLCGEYALRATNHKELLESLKAVNTAIQNASCLRMGKAKTATVTAARAAVKKNNIAALFKIIATGRGV